ncbi:MAG: TrkA family potassium uptake protein [Phormidesmis sp.]
MRLSTCAPSLSTVPNTINKAVAPQWLLTTPTAMRPLSRNSFQRINTGILFFSITILVAVLGYIIAGWTPLDAIYMVVITIFGVGYGEVNPLETASLRIFTILVIIAGALSVAYIVAGFVQLVTEGEIRRALHIRQMTQEIDSLHNHVIVCGYGRMGQMLAQKLRADHQKFIILDKNTERIDDAQEHGYLVYLGDATDEEDLQAVGISRARVLATVLPSDAANVFISLTARELSPHIMVIARGTLPSSEKKLRLAGADQVVLPATIGALRIAHLISRPNAVNFLAQNDDRVSLNELLAEIDIQINELAVTPESALLKRTVGDVENHSQGTFIIVALKRADGTITIHPNHQEVLYENDVVMIMGHQGDMPNFAQRSALKTQLRYRGARVR